MKAELCIEGRKERTEEVGKRQEIDPRGRKFKICKSG
jgi:hypothetical protein